MVLPQRLEVTFYVERVTNGCGSEEIGHL